jgi:hypothetical protein
MFVYFQSEPRLYTVGFFNPSGTWVSESDHETADAAARRVHWLNGGTDTDAGLIALAARALEPFAAMVAVLDRRWCNENEAAGSEQGRAALEMKRKCAFAAEALLHCRAEQQRAAARGDNS